MIWNSLRVRLLVTWALFIALALQLAGIGLRIMFERAITRRTELELRADLRQLKRGMEMHSDGTIAIVRAPTDPQFDIPFGGRYWQITREGSVLLRSASLMNQSLGGAAHLRPQTSARLKTWLIGPEHQKLFAILEEHKISAHEGTREQTLQLTAAVDASEINEDTDKFTSDLFAGLAGLATLLLAGAWAHVSIGLKPLERLRARVAAVRKGSAASIEGTFPDEVMPLVSETNDLLESQAGALETARKRAGDLAHGLKTPLAVMAAKSRELERHGEDAIAREIQNQVDLMNRHVERELAKARARGASRTAIEPIDTAALLEAIVSVLQGLPRNPPLAWQCDIPGRLPAAVDADDFNNMAGNLIENAQKWAKTKVNISAHERPRGQHAGLILSVEDDGPGVADEDMPRVMKRGERADTSVAGSGLGLAIVSDLAELYKGRIELSRSPLGGLKAVLTI